MTHSTQHNVIANALSQLSPGHREALILINIKGISYKEAARTLKKSERVLRLILSAARASLQNILETPVATSAAEYMSPAAIGYISAFPEKQTVLH